MTAFEGECRSIIELRGHLKLCFLVILYLLCIVYVSIIVSTCSGCCPDCQYYYRNVMVFVPGGMAALAILILLTLVPFKIGALKNAGKLSNFIIHTRGGGGSGALV